MAVGRVLISPRRVEAVTGGTEEIDTASLKAAHAILVFPFFFGNFGHAA